MEVEAEIEGWRPAALGSGKRQAGPPPCLRWHQPGTQSQGRESSPSFILSCSVHPCTRFQQRLERTRTCRFILSVGAVSPSPGPGPAKPAPTVFESESLFLYTCASVLSSLLL